MQTSTETLRAFPVALLENTEAAYWQGIYRYRNQGLPRAWISIGGGTATAFPGLDILAFNRVLGLGVHTRPTPQMLQAIIDWYGSLEVPRFMIPVAPEFLDGRTESLLLKAGFTPHNQWMKWSGTIPGPVQVPHIPFTVQEEGPELKDAFASLVCESFDWPKAAGIAMADTMGQSGYRHYMVWDKNRLAGGGALFSTPGMAVLMLACTHPDYRGSGIQQALIARRMNDAWHMGHRTIMSETGMDTPKHPNPSYRNMARMGMEEAYARTNYVYTF